MKFIKDKIYVADNKTKYRCIYVQGEYAYLISANKPAILFRVATGPSIIPYYILQFCNVSQGRWQDNGRRIYPEMRTGWVNLVYINAHTVRFVAGNASTIIHDTKELAEAAALNNAIQVPVEFEIEE